MENFCGNNQHIFEYYEKWHNETWIANNKCLKCNINIGASIIGCQKSIDKQHKYVNDYFIENGINYMSKYCINCGKYMKKRI